MQDVRRDVSIHAALGVGSGLVDRSTLFNYNAHTDCAFDLRTLSTLMNDPVVSYKPGIYFSLSTLLEADPVSGMVVVKLILERTGKVGVTDVLNDWDPDVCRILQRSFCHVTTDKTESYDIISEMVELYEEDELLEMLVEICGDGVGAEEDLSAAGAAFDEDELELHDALDLGNGAEAESPTSKGPTLVVPSQDGRLVCFDTIDDAISGGCGHIEAGKNCFSKRFGSHAKAAELRNHESAVSMAYVYHPSEMNKNIPSSIREAGKGSLETSFAHFAAFALTEYGKKKCHHFVLRGPTINRLESSGTRGILESKGLEDFLFGQEQMSFCGAARLHTLNVSNPGFEYRHRYQRSASATAVVAEPSLEEQKPTVKKCRAGDP